MKDGRHIIWSNDIDYDDWREDLEEQYPDLTEAERMELMYELNGDYLDDERSNLDIQLSRPILVVGDLGLWNGRRMGYKEIPSGNIRDCLYNERDIDYSTWYGCDGRPAHSGDESIPSSQNVHLPHGERSEYRPAAP